MTVYRSMLDKMNWFNKGNILAENICILNYQFHSISLSFTVGLSLRSAVTF